MRGQTGNVDIVQNVVVAHLFVVDGDGLLAPVFVRQLQQANARERKNILYFFSPATHDNLQLELETTRAKQRLVDHVHAVGHADQEDVVEGVDTVNLQEELVDDRVLHASAVRERTTRLLDGVNLVEDTDMQAAVVTLELVLSIGVGKQLAHVLFRLAHILGQDLWASHNLAATLTV